MEILAGQIHLVFDMDVLETIGADLVPRQLIEEAGPIREAALAIDTSGVVQLKVEGDVAVKVVSTSLRTDGVLRFSPAPSSADSARDSRNASMLDRYGAGGFVLTGLSFETDADGRWSVTGKVQSGSERIELFWLPAVLFDVEEADAERAQGMLRLIGELAITEELADRLGAAETASMIVGNAYFEIRFKELAEDRTATELDAPTDPEVQATGTVTTSSGTIGPDVIVGVLHQISNYGHVGGISAFAVGTVSCNAGDETLNWFSGTPDHPVIAQNLYRYKNDRFEQIGQSWVKHGFAALAGNACGFGCQNPGTTTLLGVGCSDPYSSSLNGTQSLLGPKSEINAFKGTFPYPPILNPPADSVIGRRIQVFNSDLNPALDGGGLYFVEGHYVAADDSAAGNQHNNAGYRRVEVNFDKGNNRWELLLRDSTQRMKAAIEAWKTLDPNVVETHIEVPGDGKFILGAKAAQIDGLWHYEYALFNLNSDRSGRSFHVPIDSSASVSNIGFHDVFYHSGELYDGQPWLSGFGEGEVSWSTRTFAENPNANALRWSTLYNFRFVSDLPPQPTQVRIGLFKPGGPDEVAVEMIGPLVNSGDCNDNGVADSLDILEGDSPDCNGNWIPDECETFPPVAIQALHVVGGLDQPVYLTAAPGDTSRLFIVEQPGVIRVFKAGGLLSAPFLDIADLVSSGGERGLLSMAFHPQYADNGFFFVNYTDLAGDTVVARYSRSTTNPDRADPGSAVVLKIIAQDFPNHNGGQLQFGPDGMFYVGMGDGGSADDPLNRAQDASTLLGKLLRLDVDRPPDFIPPDNPFAGGGLPLDEIWAFGLRHPWRFSFDALTGDLYLSDVGQSAHEEVNFQPPDSTGGENYGWRCMEGFACTGLSGCTCNAPSLTLPIFTYPNADADCAIIGGYVYRGCEIPSLHGHYFYADFCSGFVRSFRYVEGEVTDEQDWTSMLTPESGPITSISSFGEDAAGELYILSLDGDVYKIAPNVGAPICGNGIIEEGEECEPPGTATCDESCQLRPGPDDCADALAVSVGEFEFDTSNATTDGPDEPVACDFGGDTLITADHWYCYSAPCQGTVEIELCDSSFDTMVAVYTGGGDSCTCPTEASAIACDDDGCAGSFGVAAGGRRALDIALTAGAGSEPSRLSFPAAPCAPYLIRVGGKSGAAGAGILRITCEPDPIENDCNENGIDDAVDLACGISLDRNDNDVPDECEVTGDYVRGGRLYDRWWDEIGTGPPLDDHPLWELRPDPKSNDSLGADTWRCHECHGWDYQGVDGQYATGPHRTGFPGITGSTSTKEELFDLLKEAPSNFGGAGVPHGHDYGSVMNDSDIDDAVAFLIAGLIDTDNFIKPAAGDFLGDSIVGEANYTGAGAVRCDGCHGPDGTNINFGTFEDPIFLGTVAVNNPWRFLHQVRFGASGSGMPSWRANNGTDQGVADLGRYVQLNFPTDCVVNEQCDDGIECTIGTCDAAGRCGFTPEDSLCEDAGSFCDGVARCVADTGCVGSGNPCLTPEACDDVAEHCGCFPPIVEGVGGRYLAVTPQTGGGAGVGVPFAIRIRPDCPEAVPFFVGPPSGDPAIAVLVEVRAQAAFLTPAEWGETVYVTGLQIVPGTAYLVEADCGVTGSDFVTLPVAAATPRFGDVSGLRGSNMDWPPPDGMVTIADILATIDRFLGLPDAPPIYRCDQVGCIPDREIFLNDVIAVVDAFLGKTFVASTLCPLPCP